MSDQTRAFIGGFLIGALAIVVAVATWHATRPKVSTIPLIFYGQSDTTYPCVGDAWDVSAPTLICVDGFPMTGEDYQAYHRGRLAK